MTDGNVPGAPTSPVSVPVMPLPVAGDLGSPQTGKVPNIAGGVQPGGNVPGAATQNVGLPMAPSKVGGTL